MNGLNASHTIMDINSKSAALIAKSAAVRGLFKIAALICIALGFIGLFLPMLPTTPFLLLAVFFSMRSSPKMHQWLLMHERLGPTLQQYFEDNSISSTVFIRAVIFLWLSTSVSLWMTSSTFMRGFLIMMAIAVSWHLYRLKK